MGTKLLPLVLSLLLLSPVTLCSAGEYQLTEDQLTTLEANLAQLEQNSRLQNDSYLKVEQSLQDSNKQIMTLQTKLTKVEALLVRSGTQITILQEKLAQAEQSTNLAETSLQTANKSLDKYEKEVKSEVRKLTWQRNVLILGLGYMATR